MAGSVATVRTLIVDDTEALRRMVAGALKKSGRFEVVAHAENGAVGVERADAGGIDLVILDLSMPVMDGVTALPRLRARLPEAKIVVFSGFEHAELRPALTEAGANAFIEKGTRLTEVVARLKVLMDTGVDPGPPED